ncbi:MAG: hypothetical protein Unbinned1322contig1001_20 [Prokaryotic dsDNA virus sp.]|jgi:hypothetical protein|nr:MAG: hypothetical protein Unbinned1322contig1001_20 [Prokaryotic dsDNA virus sp.]|tara:strand:+ start:25089 stop:25637 length:549 start_codon:yes stop_codon:yes gene_type:complete
MQTKTLKIGDREIQVRDDGLIIKPEWVHSSGLKQRRRETMGSYGARGYLQVRLTVNGQKKLFYVHRLVAEAFSLDWNPALQVDHIDGSRDNNRAANLRMVTNQQNMRASVKTYGAIQYRGVSNFSTSKRNPFKAQIQGGGKKRHLGLFPTAEAAAHAYDEAAIKFGFSPEALNFPNQPNSTK